jgi:RND family efflux transporter MFP subunit
MWASPDKVYAGRVREIAPAAETATRAFNVRVSVTDADDKVKLGMTAGVKIIQQQAPQSAQLLIPLAALTEINGKKLVWVIDAENKAQLREVAAGEFTEDGVLIASGLQTGEKIAIAGVHTLVKGQPVKPVAKATP